MSLWSPVDLVSGGTGKTNTNLTNIPLNSPQFRSAKRDDKCPQSYTSSLLYDHLLRRSSSKLNDNKNVISKDLNAAINRVVMYSNDTSSGFQNLKKKQSIKGSVGLRLEQESHNSVTEEAIPLLKHKTSDEVNENCDKFKRIKNSNTMSNNEEEEDCVLPLDLCVKRVRPESESSNINTNRNNSIFNKSNASYVDNTHSTHNNASAAINTPQYNPSSHSSRKRGRKPKSLLATSDLMVASNLATLSNFIDTKPRKRGRPPTLSPPLSSICGQQPLAAHSSNLNKALSSGAFQSHFPYAVLNTPLQPGWPSLSSTGQLIFPQKVNGNEVNNFKHNKSSANVSESSDNLDSLASDSDSNDESDAGSQMSAQMNAQISAQISANKTSKTHQLVTDITERFNENELRIPLQLGWRRETKILKMSKSGLDGEVVYYSPCARKFKNHNEIIKYLMKNGITNISKNHFSFNPKAIVGNYIQRLHNSSTDILLNEKEFRKQLDEMRRSALTSDKKRKPSIDSNLQNTETQLRQLMESARMASTRDSKRTKFEDFKRQTELNFNEERLGLMRLEKISKTHRIEESRKKRREDLEKQRQEEMVRKVQERELKRQQLELMREQDMQRRREMLIMADLERERRRQHMMLVRALEAHKKQEEKERKKEEILAEKLRIQEKRIQKKRIEMELLRELKKPVDDMMSKDMQPLPTFNRIPGLKLPGKAFADTLMVFEFLHNFGETLGFDMESLPTLNTLTMALLNIEESAEEELLSVIHHLLVCAIEDPGIPFNVTTVMGQKLKDAAITNYNITEILRLYFQAFDSNIRDDAKEHRVESRIAGLLQNACPFLSLNATQKAEILAFLCNELMCNQAIVKQVEDSIETVGIIRRDKWLLENDLRKWKTIKMKREKKNSEQNEEKKIETETGEEESGDSDAEEQQNGSVINNNDSEEEPGLTDEEIDKKIDKLNKQFNQINNKLNKATNTYRVSPLGQDRYRRRYWVLPNAGGVFIEGIESGETEELHNNIWTEEDEQKARQLTNSQSEDLEEKDDVSEQTKESVDSSEELSKTKEVCDDEEEEEDEEKCVKETTNSDEKDDKESIKQEMDSTDISKVEKEIDEIKKESNVETDDENKEKSLLDFDLKNNSIIESKSDTKITPKKPKASEEGNTSNNEQSLQNESWMSPFFASVLAGSLMLNNGSSGGSSNGMSASQLPLSFPFGLDGSHNISGSQTKSSASDKIWFSILPRMPCDQSISDSESIKSEDLNQTNVSKDSNKCSDISISPHHQKLLQQSPLSSLMNGLPSNLFMQAFLYPHILSSLFNQHSLGGGPCPPDTSPFSFGPSPSTKNTTNCKQSSLKNNDTFDTESQESKQMINVSTSDVLLDSELEICPSLQKRIAQQREQQFDCPQKIPNEFQMGWWRITDSSQLKILVEVLSNKGVRERQLQKHLLKYMNYASLSCKSSVAELDITDMDRQIGENCAYGAPIHGKCPHDICIDIDWCREVALRFDIAVLEQIEALEEKIATSSMQIRNWKPLPRISSNQSMNFKAAADFPTSNEDKSPENKDNEDECEDNEESDDNKLNESQEEETGEINPVIVGRDRLLVLENVIERRYLKPPLGFKSNTILVSTNNSDVGQTDDYNDNAADENATSGLLRWREAVREAKCSAEIALCLHFLESCIAWDKSIMRASCQFCGSGENEAQLLLCDGCDKGYHMYCFKPKMEAIPEGDWFCFECQNKNTIDKVCVVCGKKGKLLNCDSCAKVFHPNCLDPPVTKPLKGKWICHMCGRKPKKPITPKTTKKNSNTTSSEEKLIETINNTSIAVTTSSANNSNKESSKRLSNGTNKSDKESKKEKKSKQSDKSLELNNCKIILDEMENHEYCWPFLLPVNTKQFPTYKKIIKKPMDTTTIRSKLDSSAYKNKEEFGLDVRLIFDNCVTFNEDESPVGQAGHQLRAFFETKWKELFGS